MVISADCQVVEKIREEACRLLGDAPEVIRRDSGVCLVAFDRCSNGSFRMATLMRDGTDWYLTHNGTEPCQTLGTLEGKPGDIAAIREDMEHHERNPQFGGQTDP